MLNESSLYKVRMMTIPSESTFERMRRVLQTRIDSLETTSIVSA